jgi:hypothetical protein
MGGGITMPHTPPSPEQTKLRGVYSSGVAAKLILDDFAGRTNNQRLTKVDQILNRLSDANVHRWEVIALFRKLQELGHGTFIEGRKGHPSRFQWSSNSIDVGKAAQGGEVPISQVSIDVIPENGFEEMRKYDFPLRGGVDAKFELPTNLSQREADRLGAFLKSLALPDSGNVAE